LNYPTKVTSIIAGNVHATDVKLASYLYLYNVLYK